MANTVPQTWEAKHQADFAAIHEALHAIRTLGTSLDGSGGPDKWLETIEAVRERVSQFQMFIPNAPHILSLLTTAEKVLGGLLAVANLATDKDA